MQLELEAAAYKYWLNSCTYLWSLNTELSNTIFSNNSINSFGRSAAMNAFTVTEMSSASCVSDKAVWTTYEYIVLITEKRTTVL